MEEQEEGSIGQSLCDECAKHASLKRFVRDHSVEGPRCGICHRTNCQACDPERLNELSNLIRALIRFYYDEWTYNHHWGGESPEDLLSDENPILEHRATPRHVRSRAGSESFFEAIFWPPYPPPDEGVSIYAGFDEGGLRHVQGSMRGTPSPHVVDLGRQLADRNHFDVEEAVRVLLTRIGDAVETPIPEGRVLHRARVGVARRYRRLDPASGFRSQIRPQPYGPRQVGAPPPPLARAGRLNRQGVSYLYLASDEDTAVAEVRPHPGHLVSTSTFRSLRPLRVMDCDADIALFATSDERLDLFHFLHSADTLMSMPVVPEEAGRYTLTQLIADVARQRGFNGLAHKSSVGGGTNLCFFDPACFEVVAGSGKVRKVEALAYTLSTTDFILEPGKGDYPVPG